MERFEAGHPVHVVMTKWGGRPHWRWSGLYLGADEHGDWLGYPPGTRYARPGRSFAADFSAVGLVPRHDAAHLVVFNQPTEQVPARVYVDMSTPPLWREDVLEAVDLDLDVVERWDGTVAMLDEDEFEAHQIELGYPPEVITLAEESAERVYAAVNAREAPYDGADQRWFEALARSVHDRA